MGNTDDQGREDQLGDPTAPVPQPAAPEPPAEESAEQPAPPAPPPADEQPWATPTAPADPYHGSSYPPPGHGQGSPGSAPYDQGGYAQGGSGQDQPYPPYGQQPPATGYPPYGQQPPATGYPPYGQQPQGTGYPPYGQQPQGTGYPQYSQPGPVDPGYGTPVPAPAPGYPSPYQPAYGAAPGYVAPRQNTGALVLTIVSGATLLFCAGVLVIPALILGIVGLTKQNDDPEGSSRMTRYGWWAYAAGVVLTIIAVLAFIGFVIAVGSSSTDYSGY